MAEKGQDEILAQLAEQAEKFSTVGELFKVFAQKLTEHEKRITALEKPSTEKSSSSTTSKSKKAKAVAK